MSLATHDTKDGITYTGATTGTVATFTILGGKYLHLGSAAGTSVVLNIICPDGSTAVPVNSQTTSAFAAMVDLPPGEFNIVVTTSAAVTGGLVRVPYLPSR
jgi:hypothetical protein